MTAQVSDQDTAQAQAYVSQLIARMNKEQEYSLIELMG